MQNIMRQILVIACLIFALMGSSFAASSIPAVQDSKIVSASDIPLMVGIMKDLRIEAEQVEGEPDFNWTQNEMDLTLTSLWSNPEAEGPYDEIMLSARWAAGDVSEESLSNWNAASRWGRLYLAEGELVFESDLHLMGGVTVKSIKGFITRFMERAEATREEMEAQG